MHRQNLRPILRNSYLSGNSRLKTLILYADPRSGANNILKIAKAFLQGMNAKLPSSPSNPNGLNRRFTDSPSTQKKISITKIQINPCRGCFGCWEKNPGKCGVADNFNGIIEKFLEADLVLWCFPMFYYGAPSIMKIFNEQLKPYTRASQKRKLPPGQKHLILSIRSFNSEEINYGKEIKQFDLLFEGKYNYIFCPQGELFNIPQMKPLTDRYLQLAKRAGAEYAVHGKFSAKTAEQLSNPLLSGRDLVRIEKIRPKLI